MTAPRWHTLRTKSGSRPRHFLEVVYLGFRFSLGYCSFWIRVRVSIGGRGSFSFNLGVGLWMGLGLGFGLGLVPDLIRIWLCGCICVLFFGRYTISHLTAKKHQTSSKSQWRRFDNWYVTFLCIRSPNCCEVLFWGVIFYILHDFSRVHLLKNPWILQQEIIDLEKPNKKWTTTNKAKRMTENHYFTLLKISFLLPQTTN